MNSIKVEHSVRENAVEVGGDTNNLSGESLAQPGEAGKTESECEAMTDPHVTQEEDEEVAKDSDHTNQPSGKHSEGQRSDMRASNGQNEVDTVTSRLLESQEKQEERKKSHHMSASQPQSSTTCDLDTIERCNNVQPQSKVPPGGLLAFVRKREVLLCTIGLVTFAIGLIMIVISVVLLDKHCVQDTTQEASFERSHSQGPYDPSQAASIDHTVLALYRTDYEHDGKLSPDNHTVSQEGSNSTQGVEDKAGETGVNLALGQPAYQSSTQQRNGTHYHAALAVDGSSSPRMAQGSCSQTEWEHQPWWYVDLGKPHLVASVHITIPNDCCVADMHNFEVRVGQEVNGQSVNGLCRHHMGTALTSTIIIHCHRQIYGQYVTILILGDSARTRNHLTLCDVMVFQ